MFKVIHCAYCDLQNATLLLPVAIDLLNTTKNNVSNMRSDTVWKNIEESVKANAMKNGIELTGN